jgi:hypothetical protein
MAAASLRIYSLLGETAPIEVDVERLRRTVDKLARGGALTDRELRLCCTGATTPVLDGSDSRSIVDSDDLTARLDRAITTSGERDRVRRRIAFAIAHSALLPHTRPSGVAGANVDRLVHHLLAYVEAAPSGETAIRSPELLKQVRDLFATGSTRQFWPYILAEDASAVEPLRRLRVPDASWLWRQIAIDAITESTSWTDHEFVASIDRSLGAVRGNELVLDKALGIVVKRLATASGRPEHALVRDLAVARWGSPLRPEHHPIWNRWTNDAGRRMVAGWLAREAIVTFFERLGGSGSDPRRARFWGRYAEAVDELWIFVGSQSRLRNSEDVTGLRAALGPTVRTLADDTINAFVLVLGGYSFVEFDTVGHALYIYANDDLPFPLATGVPTTHDMRIQSSATDRITHQGGWEARARDRVGDLTGTWVRF